MTLAIIRDGSAVELTPGADVVFMLDVVYPVAAIGKEGEQGYSPPTTRTESQQMTAAWASVELWDEAHLNERGIYTVTDAAIGPGHKLGPMVVTVAGGVTTITRAAVALAGDELAANLAARKVTLKDSVMGLRDARIGNGVCGRKTVSR